MTVEPKNSQFHPLPVIGHPDSFYVKHIQLADQAGDVHARESQKVGRYVTLAMDTMMPWDEKLRHFHHALKRHCVPPPGATPDVEQFYGRLADVVRRHAGQEAVRMISKEVDSLLRRKKELDPVEFHELAAEIRHRIFGDSDTYPAWMTLEAVDQINRLLARLA